MAKRKKYPQLPNGFGSIRYLGKGRRNPYAVHPPTRLDNTTGDITDRPAALCYVDDYMVGMAVLTAWHAGNYKPGYELTIKQKIGQESSIETISNRLLSDYRKIAGVDMTKPTFSQVYDRFFAEKFPDGHKYSDAMVRSTRAAFKNCEKLHNITFCNLKYNDLQSVIDNCSLKHASLELIVNLFHQMYQYATMNDICEKDYSAGVKIKKTDAGKKRMVPIHSCIKSMVSARIDRHEKLLPIAAGTFRRNMDSLLKRIGITEHHTPHNCRHTFSYLCEKYEVAENDRKRMLGHAFSSPFLLLSSRLHVNFLTFP